MNQPQNNVYLDLTGNESDVSSIGSSVQIVAKKQKKGKQNAAVGNPIHGPGGGVVINLAADANKEINITVAGKARSYQQRQLGLYGRYFSPSGKKMKDFLTECKRQQAAPGKPWDDALEMELRFKYPIPKSIKNPAKLAALEGKPYTQKVDVDNLSKFVFDALSKVYYEDDKLIYKLTVSKVYVRGNASTEICLRRAY